MAEQNPLTKMKNRPKADISIRYGFYPSAGLALIALVLMAASSPIGAALIALLLIPLLLLVSTRPFLIVSANEAGFVSLASSRISKTISHEELALRLPAMRWFLRKRDLMRLAALPYSVHKEGPPTR